MVVLFCFVCVFFVVWQQFSMVCLTNRLYIAVRLFSNRSQMKSKFGKDKKVAHEPHAIVSLMLSSPFLRLLWSIIEQTHGNIESIRFLQWTEKKKWQNGLVTLDCSRIFKVLTRSKRKHFQNYESLVDTHKMATVVKVYFSLGIFKSPRTLFFFRFLCFFLLVNSSC